MINWRVRFANKQFWLAFIPAVQLAIQAIAKVFGFELDLGEFGNNMLGVVEAVFLVLTILGIVTDPTTEGVGDSQRAMTYEKPAK